MVARQPALTRFLLPLLLLTVAQVASGQDAPLAFTHLTLVDVATGQRLSDRTVIVEGDRITAVGPAGAVMVPERATVIDGSGLFMVPGFADMHVHLYTEGDLLTYVTNGVTMVRNMAGDATHLAMRRRVAEGLIVGPRIVTAGPVVEAPPLSHPDNAELSDPAAVRGEVLRQRAAGYDFIKVYNALAPAVYESLVAVAAELGMAVAGHVPVEVGLDGALAARQASIEHFRGYVQALAVPPLPASASFRDWSLAWNDIDTTRLPGLTARTVAAGVWNVPTLAFTVHEMQPAAGHARLLARPELRYLSLRGLPADRTTGYLAPFSAADFAAVQRGLEGQSQLLRALDAAGAELLVGTDSWLSGFAFADELELLVRAGLSPARVLRMATHDAARFLGEADAWGRIAPGLRADLVLLEADPLVDITNTRRIRAVVLNGRMLDRPALDALLDQAEAAAAASKK